MKVEYKVRPITRYIVTRFETNEEEDGACSGGSSQHGTFENGETAYHVAYALCKADHIKSGEPIGSTNFIYPKIPYGVSVAPSESQT